MILSPGAVVRKRQYAGWFFEVLGPGEGLMPYGAGRTRVRCIRHAVKKPKNPRKYKLRVGTQYVFPDDTLVQLCRNCMREETQHANNGQCLFSPTRFESE